MLPATGISPAGNAKKEGVCARMCLSVRVSANGISPAEKEEERERERGQQQRQELTNPYQELKNPIPEAGPGPVGPAAAVQRRPGARTDGMRSGCFAGDAECVCLCVCVCVCVRV